jgi:hypothetical protein
MPPIHGSLSNERFLAFGNLCNLHGVKSSDLVSIIAENAMDDQVFFMNAVQKVKTTKKEG